MTNLKFLKFILLLLILAGFPGCQTTKKPKDMGVKLEIDICEHDDLEDFTCWPRIVDAINRGDLALVKEIIEGGMDPNTRFNIYYGTTPLQEAARAGQVEIAQYLLSRGADPAMQIPINPIEEAEKNGLKDLANEMRSHLTK